MANIQRPLKTFGTRKYATERAAAPGNKAPILSAELDLDLDTIYNAWNTGIDASNIVPGTVGNAALAPNAVTSDKIANGTIALADLGPNCVDSSKIVDGSIAAIDLAANAVTTAKILDGNVTIGKLAAGASVFTSGKHRRESENINFSNITVAAYLTVNSIQARNTGMVLARVVIFGLLSNSGAVDQVFGIRVNRDGANFEVFSQKGQGINAPFTLCFDDILLVDTALHNYTVDIFSSGGGICIANGGSLVLMAPA